MPVHDAVKPMRTPWSVPVAVSEVPETGRHLDLVADERTRAAIAKLAGLADLPRLAASFDVTLRGRDGLRVVGRVGHRRPDLRGDARADRERDRRSDRPRLRPGAAIRCSRASEVEAGRGCPSRSIGGQIDLGAIATEFLMLGIDPLSAQAGRGVRGRPAAMIRRIRSPRSRR